MNVLTIIHEGSITCDHLLLGFEKMLCNEEQLLHFMCFAIYLLQGCHFYVTQCLGDGGSLRVLASVFVCLKNFMIFLKFVFIFVLFIRFPSSNELCPKVYCLILENAIQFVRMCIAVS